jgi:RHS repeat-associated protein
VTFTDANNDGVVSTTDIKQINHYYPFGLNMEGNWQGGLAGQNKYQYNGKELNQDFGLDWNDYGARFYDAAVGRWTAVDPLAEKYMRWSTYNYTKDNPIKFIDPDGRDVIYLFNDVAPFGSHLSGHSAIMIGSDSKGWTYYSKSGDNNPDGSAIVDSKNFKSVQDFYDQYASSGTHSAGFYMVTTPEQDNAMLASAKKNASTPYELEGNNCADMCRKILSDGKLNVGERQTIVGITWPRADLGEISSKNEGQNLYFMPKGKDTKTVEGQVKQSESNKKNRQNNTFFFSQLLNADGSIKVADGKYMFNEQGKLNKVD